MALLYNAAGQYPAAVGAIERAYTTLGTMTRDDDTNNWTRQECATRVASGAITANRFFVFLLSTSKTHTQKGAWPHTDDSWQHQRTMPRR